MKDLVSFASQQLYDNRYFHIGSSCLWNHHVQSVNKMAVKLHRFKVKEVWNIRNILIQHECEGGIENLSRESLFGITRLAEWWQRWFRGTNFSIFTWIMDSFSCSPLTFYFKISFQKSLNTLRCNITLWCHLTTNTTNEPFSRDSLVR